MTLHGRSLIGSHSGTGSTTFAAVDAASGETLDPPFVSATAEDIDRACSLASEAARCFGHAPGAQRAALLRSIATHLESGGEALIDRARRETALPDARLRSELSRTCAQLRMFGDLAEEGSWVDARIDHGDPARIPLAKPDVRSMLRPLGVVAVFGASNFPLAFSVAGGDTAAALAAGCPVIVKAHAAHPGTSELAAIAVRDALVGLDMPEGIFSLLFDAGFDAGLALVQHPAVKAVGFTGSRRGGEALVEAARRRAQPIPVYAEMGSVNPIFVLPFAASRHGDAIAAGLHASVTLGAGQFCTNPGIVVLGTTETDDAIVAKLEELMRTTPAAQMLTRAICDAYGQGAERLGSAAGVETLVAHEAGGGRARPALFSTTAEALLADRTLAEEVFGPATLVVRCATRKMIAFAEGLEGQLTATIHAEAEDRAITEPLLAVLERKAGRVVINGFPTGVEVGHAMVHGGPYPATSDGRSSSVGTRAIERFTRPVCYQNVPDDYLPRELQENNPLRIRRIVDGRFA